MPMGIKPTVATVGSSFHKINVFCCKSPNNNASYWKNV